MSVMKIICAALVMMTAPLVVSAQVIETEADYAVIMDYETGTVLYSKNGDTPMIPASMTKIMTAFLVFERLSSGEIQLDDTFTVSENAWRNGGWATGGSTMGLAIGSTPTVAELLRGVIVLSGNDACIVLAEGISGSEDAFATEMTDLAHTLGLTSASFKNASGLLADGHEMSARDLAELARLTIEKYPEFYEFYAETEMTWNGIRQTNRNPLLGQVQGADGLKTGHLEASGYGLTASAERDGERRIVVLNGLPSMAARAQEAERMMRLAFSSFEKRTFDPGDRRLAELDVWMGETRTVGVRLADPISVTAHKRAFSRGTSEIVYDAPLEAPIKAGDQVATLIVTLEGKPPIEAPLIATESIARLGFVGRAIEGLSYKLGSGDQ